VMAQGRKRVLLGDEAYVYDPARPMSSRRWTCP
jgi:hypothetical protein